MGSWEDGQDGAGTRVVAVRGGQTGDLEGNKEGSIGGGRVQVSTCVLICIARRMAVPLLIWEPCRRSRFVGYRVQSRAL